MDYKVGGDKSGDNSEEKAGKRNLASGEKYKERGCPQYERVMHKVIHIVLHEGSRELSHNPPALLLIQL